MGHGAWGLGHGALGIGHWALGIGRVPYFPENRYRYLQGMCEVISHNWHKSVPEIKEAVIAEVRRHTAYPRLMKH